MTSPKSIRIPMLVIIGCALLGAWASGALLIDHDGGWDSQRSGVAAILGLCESISLASASCAEVVGSKWGSIDFTLGGKHYLVPTSFIGVVYFVAIAIWFGVLGLLRAATRRLWGLSVWAIACGVIVSVALVAMMVGVLSHWCPLCGIAHAANGAILAASIVVWRRSCIAGKDSSGAATGAVWRGMTVRAVAVATVAIGGVTVLSWSYYDAMRSTKRQWHKVVAYRELIGQMRSDPEFLLREYFAQPVEELGSASVSADGGTGGAARLVVFGDFSCKACACFTRKWDARYREAFPNNVAVEFRQVRVNDDSEGRTTNASEGGAIAAALAAEAVRTVGGERAYQQICRILFDNRKSLTHDLFDSAVRNLGLDADEFLAEAASESVLQKVEADMELSRRLDVRATPTVFLNGRRVPELCLRSKVFWNAVAPVLTGRSEATASILRVDP